jgi:hypothetical protein
VSDAQIQIHSQFVVKCVVGTIHSTAAQRSGTFDFEAGLLLTEKFTENRFPRFSYAGLPNIPTNESAGDVALAPKLSISEGAQNSGEEKRRAFDIRCL